MYLCLSFYLNASFKSNNARACTSHLPRAGRPVKSPLVNFGWKAGVGRAPRRQSGSAGPQGRGGGRAVGAGGAFVGKNVEKKVKLVPLRSQVLHSSGCIYGLKPAFNPPPTLTQHRSPFKALGIEQTSPPLLFCSNLAVPSSDALVSRIRNRKMFFVFLHWF